MVKICLNVNEKMGRHLILMEISVQLETLFTSKRGFFEQYAYKKNPINCL